MMERTRCIECVMDDIGIPKHLKGYDCIFYAIEHQLENRGGKITDGYAYAADKLDITNGAAERNIRHCINYMIINNNPADINNYFGSSRPVDGCITNGQFIVTLAVAVRRLMRGEEFDVNNGR